MHAVRIPRHGGPEVLEPVDLPDPEPGEGQVLVELAAVGVNFIDTYFREGIYPAPLPLVPGLEGAGTVRAVGPGVTTVAPGDRVAWTNVLGSYATLVVAPAAELVVVPDTIDLETATAVSLQGMTAHYLVHDTHPVAAGEDVLVHAAAGGMGLLLCQMLRAKGARIIATTSSEEKDALAREAGAHETLRYGDDLAERVRALTDGGGVAVVYDGVGASTFDASLASLRVRGVLALYGAASGPVPPVDPQRLNSAGSVYLTRPSLAWHVRTPSELAARAGAVFSAVAAGDLSVRIGGRYPLDAAADAQRDLQSRRTTGKLLLLP
ncbi:quinone oxidoreductase [Actinomycetospora sp. NBRC 106375]|uniref:quinone oxidoreductase family protein n=1 Tax=Actinomycetospora sp. NBRC 106375 TaxID=3032207 RepID=UPI0024A42925|nr:quinone oxidoreductase [Actinomycetospora sp. NBRC 106375]GLZ44056.1 quinone oxidoreductase [Actinomycetospora sp. NBRC 106375]